MRLMRCPLCVFCPSVNYQKHQMRKTYHHRVSGRPLHMCSDGCVLVTVRHGKVLCAVGGFTSQPSDQARHATPRCHFGQAHSLIFVPPVPSLLSPTRVVYPPCVGFSLSPVSYGGVGSLYPLVGWSSWWPLPVLPMNWAFFPYVAPRLPLAKVPALSLSLLMLDCLACLGSPSFISTLPPSLPPSLPRQARQPRQSRKSRSPSKSVCVGEREVEWRTLEPLSPSHLRHRIKQ